MGMISRQVSKTPQLRNRLRPTHPIFFRPSDENELGSNRSPTQSIFLFEAKLVGARQNGEARFEANDGNNSSEQARTKLH